MKRLVLIHWNTSEYPERAARLEALGYIVDPIGSAGPEALRLVRTNPPDGFVIDLSRLPSQGKAVATALRGGKTTRLVPLIFVEGSAEKLEGVKALLPDARYTHWDLIGPVLDHALTHPPKEVVVPRTMDAYVSSPLTKKLGVLPKTSVIALGAPKSLEQCLGQLPEGASISRSRESRSKSRLVLLFARSAVNLEKEFPYALKRLANDGALWIAWPKKTSAIVSDLTQQAVRQFGIEMGLVDYKICAIDETWSGLRFARRKTN